MKRILRIYCIDENTTVAFVGVDEAVPLSGIKALLLDRDMDFEEVELLPDQWGSFADVRTWLDLPGTIDGT